MFWPNLIAGELRPRCHKFDVIAEATSGELEHISYLNPSLMPLQYPFLFPYRDPSFQVSIEYQHCGAGQLAEGIVKILGKLLLFHQPVNMLPCYRLCLLSSLPKK